MDKKTRLFILIFCILCFFIIAPILVAYSEGYRFDFEKFEVTETGGIYVRTFPAADQITIDSNISDRPGFLANSVFVQSLIPKNHTVAITKTLPVQKKQVTKLENVLLFKKTISFSAVADKTLSPFNVVEKYLLKNNNLYYSNIPANSTLTATQKATPALKSLVAFSIQGNSVLWLGADGLLHKTDFSATPAVSTKLTLTALKINKKDTYKIITDGQDIFVNAGGKLLILDNKKNDFVRLADSVIDAKISPDNKNLAYLANNKIYLYTISDDPSRTYLQPQKTITLNEPENPCDTVLWLNKDYIIFTSENKIVMSEIDYRGNINTTTLPQTVTLADKTTISIVNPKISFDQGNQKLYILTGDTLLLSEKITP